MRSQKLGLSISVPNRVSGKDGDQMSVNLKFETLRDFEPGNVARQVPELNKLLELRQALSALKGPLGNVPAFRRKLQEMVTDEKSRERLLKELDIDGGDNN
jgi:type VI secretion system protein ImpB